MAASPISNEALVSILIEAERRSDEATAQRFGVSRDQILKWRKDASSDPELSRLLDVARRKALGAWREEIAQTAVAIARAIRRKVNAGEDPSFALISAAKIFGAANIQADTLLGEDNGDDE
jgi:transcriptional regulator with XRE-family HTH domain